MSEQEDAAVDAKATGDSATLETFDGDQVSGQSLNGTLDMIKDISVELSVEIGRTKMNIEEVLSFHKGTVINLEKALGEPLEVSVNGVKIAEGEVVVLDEQFGIRITDIHNVVPQQQES